MKIKIPWEEVRQIRDKTLPGEVTALLGRPKGKKTAVTLAMASLDYQNHNRTVLLSRETPSLLMSQRFAATVAGVDYLAHRSRTLPPEDGRRMLHLLENLLAPDSTFYVCGDAQSLTDIDELILRKKPQVFYIDSAYLLGDWDERPWSDRHTEKILWGIRDLARKRNLPVILNSQITRHPDLTLLTKAVDHLYVVQNGSTDEEMSLHPYPCVPEGGSHENP